MFGSSFNTNGLGGRDEARVSTGWQGAFGLALHLVSSHPPHTHPPAHPPPAHPPPAHPPPAHSPTHPTHPPTWMTSLSCSPKAARKARSTPMRMVAEEEAQVEQAP